MSNEPTIHVRVVSDEEIPIWAHLTAVTVDARGGPSEEEIAGALANASPHVRSFSAMAWLGEPDGHERAVARMRLVITGHRAEMWGLGIDPQAVEQGKERAILHAVEAHARAAGVRHLTVQVIPGRVTLLARAGYRLTKARVDMVANIERRPVSCNRLLRPPRPGDEKETEAIGRVYYESYRGTIDDDGGTLEEGVEEARRCFAGDYGEFLTDCSYVLEGDDGPAGAALVTEQDDDAALLAEVMIRPEYRGKGYARPLIQSAMNACAERGMKQMVLVVTRNNVPAEGLYRRMGFVEYPGSEVYHLEKEL